MVGPKQAAGGGGLGGVFIFMPVIQEMHTTPFVGCAKMSLQVFIMPNYKAASVSLKQRVSRGGQKPRVYVVAQLEGRGCFCRSVSVFSLTDQ